MAPEALEQLTQIYPHRRLKVLTAFGLDEVARLVDVQEVVLGVIGSQLAIRAIGNFLQDQLQHLGLAFATRARHLHRGQVTQPGKLKSRTCNYELCEQFLNVRRMHTHIGRHQTQPRPTSSCFLAYLHIAMRCRMSFLLYSR